LPVITVGPVLVIVDPARTAKLRAVPRLGWVAAKAAAGHAPAIAAVTKATRKTLLEWVADLRVVLPPATAALIGGNVVCIMGSPRFHCDGR
jgi:hypothetical protein